MMKNKDFFKELFVSALPIALQFAVVFSIPLCDNIMLGIKNGAALSSLYVCQQVHTVLQVIATGMEGCILVICSRLLGKKDENSAKSILSFTLQLALPIGALFLTSSLLLPEKILGIFTNTADVVEGGVGYLRIVAFSYPLFILNLMLTGGLKVSKMRLGVTVSTISALCVKFTTNYIFIFVTGTGLVGAAVATVITRVCEFCVLLFFTSRKSNALRLSPKELFRIEKSTAKSFFKDGAPIILAQLVWGANMLFMSSVMGRLGKSVISALSIANTAYTFLYIPMNALSVSLGIITAKNIGKRDTGAVFSYVGKMQALFLCAGGLFALSMFLTRGAFVSLYDVEPDVAATALGFIAVFSVTIIGTYYQSGTLYSVVRSCGDASFVLKNDLFFLVLFTVPATFIALRLGLAAKYILFILKADQLLKCAVAFVKMRKKDYIPSKYAAGSVK